MNKVLGIAGWLVFVAMAVRAALHTGPDDPMTAELKSAGAYGLYLAVMGILFVLALLWCAILARSNRRTRRRPAKSQWKGY